jgi:hypothetical protein
MAALVRAWWLHKPDGTALTVADMMIDGAAEAIVMVCWNRAAPLRTGSGPGPGCRAI